MVSPNHIRAYSLRPEELLVESARERLVVQAARNAATAEASAASGARRDMRDFAPAAFVITAFAAFAGWLASLG